MEELRAARFYAYQQAKADNMNEIGETNLEAFNTFLEAFMAGFTIPDSLIFQEFNFTPQGGNFKVDCGLQGVIGLRKADGTMIGGVYKGTRAAEVDPYTEEELEFDAPDAQDRIDIIEAEVVYEDAADFTENVPILDPMASPPVVTLVAHPTRKVQKVKLYVKKGTPAPSPVAPAATADRMTIREVYIDSAAVEILAPDILATTQDPSLTPWTTAHATRLWPSLLDMFLYMGYLTSLRTITTSSIVDAINEIIGPSSLGGVKYFPVKTVKNDIFTPNYVIRNTADFVAAIEDAGIFPSNASIRFKTGIHQVVIYDNEDTVGGEYDMKAIMAAAGSGGTFSAALFLESTGATTEPIRVVGKSIKNPRIILDFKDKAGFCLVAGQYCDLIQGIEIINDGVTISDYIPDFAGIIGLIDTSYRSTIDLRLKNIAITNVAIDIVAPRFGSYIYGNDTKTSAEDIFINTTNLQALSTQAITRCTFGKNIHIKGTTADPLSVVLESKTIEDSSVDVISAVAITLLHASTKVCKNVSLTRGGAGVFSAFAEDADRITCSGAPNLQVGVGKRITGAGTLSGDILEHCTATVSITSVDKMVHCSAPTLSGNGLINCAASISITSATDIQKCTAPTFTSCKGLKDCVATTQYNSCNDLFRCDVSAGGNFIGCNGLKTCTMLGGAYNITGLPSSFYVFENCTNIEDCSASLTGNSTPGIDAVFNTCTNIKNCTLSISGAENAKSLNGFRQCNNIYGCTANITDGASGSRVRATNACNQIHGCTIVGTGLVTGAELYAFDSNSRYISNCSVTFTISAGTNANKIGFNICRHISSCTTDGGFASHFSSCQNISDCRVIGSGSDNGFLNSDNIASCHSNGPNFSGCENITGCRVISTGGSTCYLNCSMITGSYGSNSGNNDIFRNCLSISGCRAIKSAGVGHAFVDCNHISACFASVNNAASVALNNCNYVSAMELVATLGTTRTGGTFIDRSGAGNQFSVTT